MAELLDLVRDRLKAQAAIFKNEVWGITELDEAKGLPAARLHTPSAYVILLAENATPNRVLPPVEQKVVAEFGIILAVDNSRNPNGLLGGGITDRLQVTRLAVRGAVLGYELDPAYSPAEYVRGRLVRVTNGVLWWQDDFRSEYYIRSY